MRVLVHVLLSPLYLLIAVQIWPILLLFGLTVVVHVLETLFPAGEA